MTLANHAHAAEAGPSGPGGAGVGRGDGSEGAEPGPGPGPGAPVDPASDPIFRAEEPVDRPVRRGTLVLQFFLVPLLIVVAAVGIFLFFGMLAGGRNTPDEFLTEVMTGSDSVQRQAAHQLGVLLQAERERVDRGEDPSKAPFWEVAGFREKLARAFVDSFPSRSEERRRFLALAIGKVGDPESLAVLEDHAGRTVRDEENPVAVRFAVVGAIGDLRTDAAVPVLADVLREATTQDEEPLRTLAVVALSRRDTPASREALRTALDDPSVFVRSEAGAALARFGDPAGAPEVARLLDEAWVSAQVERRPSSSPASDGKESPPSGGGTPDRASLRRAFLANGLRGALGLRDEAFRPRVEALTRDGDEHVRRLAREVLDRWPRA